MKIRKKSRGFTLVEVLIVSIILTIIFGAVFVFMTHSLNLNQKHTDEFYFQADMRDTMQIIDERVKKSSAVFAVPESQFIDSSGNYKMDEEWSYIGVSKKGVNKGQVCVFEYKKDSAGVSKWHETRLSSGRKNVEFDLEFTKKYEEGLGQKLLSYTLKGIPTDGTPPRELSTQVEVLSAYTVVNRGTDSDRAVSIAFRSGEREFPYPSSITFVIDTSGSMIYDGNRMDTIDEDGKIVKRTRFAVVNDAIKQMLSSIAASTKVDVGVVDFSNYGDALEYPGTNKKYINLNTNYDKVAEVIDIIRPGRKVSGVRDKVAVRGGWTNVGDGLRIAYHTLLERVKTISDSKKRFNYVVILMDGEPNMATFENALLKPSPVGAPYEIKFYEGNLYYGSKSVKESDWYRPGFDPWARIRYNSNYRSLVPIEVVYLEEWNDAPRKLDVEYKIKTGQDSLTYSTVMAEQFKKAAQAKPPIIPNLKTFIVTVGNPESYKANVQAINKALGNTENDGNNYFKGDDPKAIQDAVDAIAKDLVYNIWSFSGPRSK